MNLTTRFLMKAATSASALALATGCVETMPRIPSTPSIYPPATNGATYPGARPNYDACAALKRALREAGMSTREVEQAADKGVNNVTRDINRGKDPSKSIKGGIFGTIATYGTEQLMQLISGPQIQQHDQNCQAQREAKEAEKLDREYQRGAGRAGQTEYKIINKRIDDCVKAETKAGVPYPQAFPACRATILGR